MYPLAYLVLLVGMLEVGLAYRRGMTDVYIKIESVLKKGQLPSNLNERASVLGKRRPPAILEGFRPGSRFQMDDSRLHNPFDELYTVGHKNVPLYFGQ